jgi:RNA polymerase sigma factor (sigma-70 family)
LHPGDLQALLRDCLENAGPAPWLKFVAHFQPLIASTVIKSARRCGPHTAELVDDLIQETYLRLCANNYRILRDFRFDDPRGFYGLLQSVAMSVTLDYFRSSSAAKRGGGHVPLSLEDQSLPVPPGQSGQTAEHRVLLEEIDRRVLAIVPPATASRDRRIFWLYYRHGFTAKDLAAIPSLKLSSKGVESVLVRITSQLRGFFSGGAEGTGA